LGTGAFGCVTPAPSRFFSTKTSCCSTGVAEAKAQAIQTIDTTGQELRKLRETRIAASPSDRLTILQLFANREKQFPAIIDFHTNVQS
jgi:hypothetical protein